MPNDEELAVAERIIQLFQHLGIERAHIAGSVAGDLRDFLRARADSIASLTLVLPHGFGADILSPFASRLLLVTGEHGNHARLNYIEKLPTAKHVALQDYEGVPWSDIAAERTDEITLAMGAFLERATQQGHLGEVGLSEGRGEVAGIEYHVRGTGPPLILFPLALSPSQWEPLIPWLSQSYGTIMLGGAHLGFVGYLEERARLEYRPPVRTLFEELQLHANEKILDVGCGSGAFDRFLAKRTNGANPIVAIDHSPYMIREARDISKAEGLDAAIDFQAGSAEAIPFPDDSFDVVFSVTVMEEVNADKMLSEMIRVTKPGGRVGVLVRSVDLPYRVNLPLPSDIKNKLEVPGVFGSGMSEGGCADASLYTRFTRSGLTRVKMLPQLAVASSGPAFQNQQNRALSVLSDAEAKMWRAAVAQAGETFFIAAPLHCAVGTKR